MRTRGKPWLIGLLLVMVIGLVPGLAVADDVSESGQTAPESEAAAVVQDDLVATESTSEQEATEKEPAKADESAVTEAETETKQPAKAREAKDEGALVTLAEPEAYPWVDGYEGEPPIELTVSDGPYRVELNGGDGVWYSFTPHGDARYRLYAPTDGVSGNPQLYLYQVSEDGYFSEEFAMDDDELCLSAFAYYADDTSYYIYATSSDNAAAQYDLYVEMDVEPGGEPDIDIDAIRDSATELALGSPVDVNLPEGTEAVFFSFTPEENGFYHFYSSDENGDPMLSMYDADGYHAYDADNEYDGVNFPSNANSMPVRHTI